MKRTGPETQHLQTARLPSVDGFEEGLTQPCKAGPVIMHRVSRCMKNMMQVQYFEPGMLAL